jgi:hypothetical protein
MKSGNSYPERGTLFFEKLMHNIPYLLRVLSGQEINGSSIHTRADEDIRNAPLLINNKTECDGQN